MTTSLEALVIHEIEKALTEAGYVLAVEHNVYNGRVTYTAMDGLEPVGERVAIHAHSGEVYALTFRAAEGDTSTYPSKNWLSLTGLHKAGTSTERVAMIVDALLGRAS